MTLQLDETGPGSSVHQSTTYTATVDTTAVYVYGATRNMHHETRVHNAGDSVEASWVTYGSDETTNDIAISLVSGNITAAIIVPDTITTSIAAGVLTVTMPKETEAHIIVTVDGGSPDYWAPIFLHSKPLDTAPTAPTDYSSLGTTVTDLGVVADMTQVSFTSDPNFDIGERVGMRSSIDAMPTYEDASGNTANWELYDLLYVTAKADDGSYTFSASSGGTAITWISDGGGTITFVSQEWTDTSTVLRFTATHNKICRGFHIGTGCTVYNARGSSVSGTLDLRGSVGCKAYGPGFWAGDHSDFETTLNHLVNPDPTIDTSLWIGIVGDTNISTHTLEGFCIGIQPSLPMHGVGPNVKWITSITPWWPHTGFLRTYANTDTGRPIAISDLLYAHFDDGIFFEQEGNTVVDRCLAISFAGSPLHFGYRPSHLPDEASAEINDVTVLSYGKLWPENTDHEGLEAIIKCHLDQVAAGAAYGVCNVTFNRLTVYGSNAGRLASIGNQQFWSDPTGIEQQGERYGQCYNWTFNDLDVKVDPDRKSRIFGRDESNTPHDFNINTSSIGGVTLTTDNLTTYFDIGEDVYNLYVDSVLFGATDAPATATFVVEDGTGLSTANALVTVATVDQYNADHSASADWIAASTSEKQQAIRLATRWISTKRHYQGYKRETTQSLAFPRYSLVDNDGWAVDNDSVPTEVQQATSYCAIRILNDDWAPFPDEDGNASTLRESFSLGGISLSSDFAGSRSSTETRLPIVEALLRSFIKGTSKTLHRG